MCRKFPDTSVIIDHLGRIGAGPDGAIRDADVEALCALAKHPKISVKVGAFYALGKKTPPYLDLIPLIKRVVQAFSPEAMHVGKRLPVPGRQGSLHRQPGPGPRPSRFPDEGRPRLAALSQRRSRFYSRSSTSRTSMNAMATAPA